MNCYSCGKETRGKHCSRLCAGTAWSPLRALLAVRMVAQGASCQDAHRATGLAVRTVSRYCREQGVPIAPRGRPVGSRWSKPSFKSARIVELYRSGEDVHVISERVGTRPDAVYGVLKRWLPRLVNPCTRTEASVKGRES